MNTATARHPNVPLRDFALTEGMAEAQIQRGLYTTDRGVRLAIPVDRLSTPTTFLNRDLWRIDGEGRVYRPGARMRAPGTKWQGKALAFLRDHVNPSIPALYYRGVLGHDLHVSTWADLYGKHWHTGWANPFNPDKVDAPLDPSFATFFATHFAGSHDCRLGRKCPAEICSNPQFWRDGFSQLFGFTEELGWLSGAKVTTAFVSEEIDELVSATGSEYADFDFHEVGTSAAAEANTQTALTTSTGIARATGTPTDADPIYRSVASITADTTETWNEHGLFNNSTGPAMMDRNLTGGQSVVNTNIVQYTYELTKNAEA